MTSFRLGVEIAPGACRIVQIDRPAQAGEGETVVRAFARTAAPDATAFAPFHRQPAAVVVWGMHGDHRQAMVTVRSYQRMRREAVKTARAAGVDTRQMLADIAPAPAPDRKKRRAVVIALARTTEVASELKRLTAMGLRVRSIVTPALALMSLARLRRRLTAAGAIEGYVALEETATAIALMRNGALVAARELEWGYRNEQGGVRPRDEVSTRLGEAIDGFFGDCGARPAQAAQVCVCGGMPELRSMTLAVTERLDVEVEPLDSLFGINPDRLPSDEFRDQVADLRLAWAVAADWNAPINFLRERRRRMAKTVLTRAAIVAGVATGLGIAWRLQQSDLLEPAPTAPRPAPIAAAPARTRPAQSAPVRQSPIQSAPVTAAPSVTSPAETRPIVSEQRPAPAPAPNVPVTAPVQVPAQIAARPPVAASAASAATRPAAPAPRSTEVAPPPPARPVRTEPAPAARPASKPALVLTPVPEPVRPARARETETTPVSAAAAAPAPAVRKPPAPEAPLPFEGVLGSILYGADRKLAIIDGRIVQVGDEVRGAQVVEITPNSVLFRDKQGRLRQLTLQGTGR